MAIKPEIFSGILAAPTDFASPGAASQVAIHNTDATGVLSIKYNGSNAWTLAAGEKLGLRLKNLVVKITLTPISGTPTFQLLIA